MARFLWLSNLAVNYLLIVEIRIGTVYSILHILNIINLLSINLL